ncbi:MAG: MBL fold metallo-hydrolase [Firmicutes bacterium]|nr:MBL fold metallo-hydrolase [Bacillota bacterium]
MKIADNVEMLEIGIGGGAIRPTLTWDDTRLVLIDAGYPGLEDLLIQAIADAGFSAENLTHIILTHQDMDHIGCVPDLLRLAPAAKVLAHEIETPYIDGSKPHIKGLSGPGVPVNQTLTDGEVLDFCGGIEVLHTPGHTPGHICLFLQKSGTLVGGDAVNIADGKIIGPNPGYTYDMELGQKSLEKIKAWPIKGLISYHCGYLKM